MRAALDRRRPGLIAVRRRKLLGDPGHRVRRADPQPRSRGRPCAPPAPAGPWPTRRPSTIPHEHDRARGDRFVLAPPRAAASERKRTVDLGVRGQAARRRAWPRRSALRGGPRHGRGRPAAELGHAACLARPPGQEAGRCGAGGRARGPGRSAPRRADRRSRSGSVQGPASAAAVRPPATGSARAPTLTPSRRAPRAGPPGQSMLVDVTPEDPTAIGKQLCVRLWTSSERAALSQTSSTTSIASQPDPATAAARVRARAESPEARTSRGIRSTTARLSATRSPSWPARPVPRGQPVRSRPGSARDSRPRRPGRRADVRRAGALLHRRLVAGRLRWRYSATGVDDARRGPGGLIRRRPGGCQRSVGLRW